MLRTTPRTPIALRTRPSLLCASLLLCAAACGPSQERGGLQLNMRFGQVSQNVMPVDAPPRGGPPADITNYRICATGADLEAAAMAEGRPSGAVCQNFDVANNPNGAGIDVPVGTDRVITFQGYFVAPNGQSEVRWCGETRVPEIVKDEIITIELFNTRCGALTFTRTPLSIPRAFHTATRLSDGRVAIIGGFSSLEADGSCGQGCRRMSASQVIDIYDPSTGILQAATFALLQGRGLHTATLLPGDRVLVAGGCGSAELRLEGGGPIAVAPRLDECPTTAEIIDFSPNAASAVQAVAMSRNAARLGHRALPVPGGMALLLGGRINLAGNCPSVLFIDGAEPRFEELDQRTMDCRNNFAIARTSALDATLQEGILAGGFDLGTDGDVAERFTFDTTNRVLTFSVPSFLTVNRPLGDPRYDSQASFLSEGQALITGGISNASQNPDAPLPGPQSAAYQIDLPGAAVRPYVEVTSAMRLPRALHTQTRLRTGQILLTGGASIRDDSRRLSFTERMEIFDPELMTFRTAQAGADPLEMFKARGGHTATTLGNGTVLIAGGYSQTDGNATDIAELYNPASTSLIVPTHPPRLPLPGAGEAGAGNGGDVPTPMADPTPAPSATP